MARLFSVLVLTALVFLVALTKAAIVSNATSTPTRTPVPNAPLLPIKPLDELLSDLPLRQFATISDKLQDSIESLKNLIKDVEFILGHRANLKTEIKRRLQEEERDLNRTTDNRNTLNHRLFILIELVKALGQEQTNLRTNISRINISIETLEKTLAEVRYANQSNAQMITEESLKEEQRLLSDLQLRFVDISAQLISNQSLLVEFENERKIFDLHFQQWTQSIADLNTWLGKGSRTDSKLDEIRQEASRQIVVLKSLKVEHKLVVEEETDVSSRLPNQAVIAG